MSRQNVVLELSSNPESVEALDQIYSQSKAVPTGRVKCTITKHRLAKVAIILGVAILNKRSSIAALGLIEKWAPERVRERGKRSGPKKIKAELVLECSSTQGLLEGVDQVWRGKINGAVSHRRVTRAALCLGLDSMTKLDPKMLRQIVSKVCPVQRKYWDEELQTWL